MLTKEDCKNGDMLIKHILDLTQRGYTISIGPGPFPKFVSVEVRKDNCKTRHLFDTTINRSNLDVLDYAIENSVWKIGEELQEGSDEK